MATFTWIPASGPAITFGLQSPYILQKRPSGLSAADADIRLERAPYQNGATEVDRRMRERIIRLRTVLWAPTEQEMEETVRALHVALNSELGTGIFRVTYSLGKVYEIGAKPDDGMPEIPESDRTYPDLPANIDLLCPHPLWYNPTEVVTTFTLGQTPQQHQKVVANLGDVPTPMEITFNGPSEKPRIETVGGSAVKVIALKNTLVDGEQVVVTTGFDAPSVTHYQPGLDPEGGMRLLELFSELFKLERGNTTLEYKSNDSGTPNRGTMVVKFKHYYRGI